MLRANCTILVQIQFSIHKDVSYLSDMINDTNAVSDDQSHLLQRRHLQHSLAKVLSLEHAD